MTDKGPARGSIVDKTLPPVSLRERGRLLPDLLRGVSRSFYLTLRILPSGLRTPVGLAYLLARAADTIADTSLLPPGERLSYLSKFRAQIEGPADLTVLRQMGLALTDKQNLPHERSLLASLPQVFSMLESVADADRPLIRSVVLTLTGGMKDDLITFPAEDSGQITALPDFVALDRYIYQVAGCVGEFWTRITMAHSPELKHWNSEQMVETGVRFGKALQLTNVLRDVPKDLRIGRCYFPLDQLTHLRITPQGLLDPAASVRARPLLVSGIETALGHFAAAEQYLLTIPRRSVRLRLAVLWPLLIGLATLSLLARNDGWLDPNRTSKVTRPWVYRTMALSWPSVSSDRLLRAWIGRLRRTVEAAL